jgi:tetratricopeptide (TPR) repeat protein
MDSSLAKDPWSPTAWANKGLVLSHLGKYEDALSSYNASIYLIEQVKFKKVPTVSRPIYAVVYAQRSEIKNALGDTAGAQADKRMAEKFDAEPPKPSWWQRLF